MLKIAIVMDPIAHIHTDEDSTLAMMKTLQARGVSIFYAQIEDLVLDHGKSFGYFRPIQVFDDPTQFFKLGEPQYQSLTAFNAVLMRKNPPFDMSYIFSTYLLEQAEREGVLIRNKPRGLRDCNEKFYATQFNKLCPPSLVSAQAEHIKAFIQTHQHCVLKPLDSMAGSQIFQIQQGDPNTNVVIETLTSNGTRPCMVQRYIPEITEGDKRIMMIYGEPASHMLVRIPAQGDFRGNLAAGASHKVVPIGEVESNIARELTSSLLSHGHVFVGIDIIGHYLTEINVTSPTGPVVIEGESTCKIIEPFIDQLINECLEKV
jgi:glutathione synthase